MAVYMPKRLKSPEKSVIAHEVSNLVRNYPDMIIHNPESQMYLVTTDVVLNDSPELSSLLNWASSLNRYPADAVLLYITQLVQSLRHDTMGYVAEFINKIALRSQLVAHQLIWNMQTNIYLDEEGRERDPTLGDTLESLIGVIRSSLSGPAKEFYEREFGFLEKITGIYGAIRTYPKGPERKKACLEEYTIVTNMVVEFHLLVRVGPN
ncbi:unnamed protein product [Allacma fusca]|uniref:PIK helical domain-containing protein n=1 Tax=Allacma fusca TaxID=39272 RepID=A0A8J2JWV6_9HEXA|nr:unnamed protein product [Allacma fusca]